MYYCVADIHADLNRSIRGAGHRRSCLVSSGHADVLRRSVGALL